MSLEPRVVSDVDALLAEATAADGVAPLSEQFLLGLTDDRLGHSHIVAERDGTIAGVVALDGDTAEMVVRPSMRRRGVGASLLADAATAAGAAGASAAGLKVRVWAHGNLPEAQSFAAAQGLTLGRRLLVMGVEGAALWAAAERPETSLSILNYAKSVERWGADAVDAAWLRANNEAFSWHPEQGGWDLARLRRGMEAAWFDPRDVIFLWDEGSEGAESSGEGIDVAPLAGFHWTKWHTEDVPHFGEIYVVGVADAYRGRGVGTPLLKAGLRRMVERGADRVILYVESDNAPAMRAYEKLGFEIVEEHAVYQK